MDPEFSHNVLSVCSCGAEAYGECRGDFARRETAGQQLEDFSLTFG